MIGHNVAAAEALSAEFAAVAKFDGLPRGERKLYDDILESVADPRIPGAILPTPTSHGCRIYAVASDQREWRRLAPLLSAFIGPTLTNFSGVIEAPLGSGAVDVFARSLPVQVIATIDANGTHIEALRVLRRMIAMVRSAPEGAARPPRPTSWLLSDFEDALNVGDRQAAERLIERLRQESRLDVMNLSFLTVQLLASLGSWFELRSLPYFTDLCLARKPATIAAKLAEALFHTELAAAFATEDPENCRRAYSNVRSLASSLVLNPPPSALGPGGWRLYAISALAAETPEPGLLGALATGPDVGWISGHMQHALIESAVETALEPEADYAQIRKALERLSKLPQDQRERLLEITTLRSLFAGNQKLDSLLAPLGWQDWLAGIADPLFTSAFEVARKGSLEWTVDKSADPVEALALSDALADALDNEISRARLAQALPLIVSWLQRDTAFPRPSMRKVYETLLTLFALGEARDRGIMASAAVVGEALLSMGSTKTDYQRLLQSLMTLISEGTSTSNVFMLLELIEATLRHPCPDTSARETFWLSALSVIEPLRFRLEPVQLASVIALGELIGWAEPPFAANTTSASDQFGMKLSNLRITIYTLTESAARQAASVIAKVAPSALVQISSEHVGSAHLKALAENSDIFVIASLSATHAATDFIRAHRPVGRSICWAAGRGFTSILRAIEGSLV